MRGIVTPAAQDCLLVLYKVINEVRPEVEEGCGEIKHRGVAPRCLSTRSLDLVCGKLSFEPWLNYHMFKRPVPQKSILILHSLRTANQSWQPRANGAEAHRGRSYRILQIASTGDSINISSHRSVAVEHGSPWT